jgi:tRNA dimethylallyltransferase
MDTLQGKIIVVVGPTASGKSDLAIAIAQKFRGEVVSADSRQVYRGMNIGTGKVTPPEMRGIPHHLLDVADPRDTYSVARYRQDAEAAVDDILRRGRIPLLAGGTAFYIDTVVNGMELPEVAPNETLRKELSQKLIEELFSILIKLDPTRAENIDPQNPHRLIRAIEIATALGKVPPIIQTPKYTALKIGINPTQEFLNRRIHSRLMNRMKYGMRLEVKRLNNNGVSWERLESFGLEYRRLAECIQKKITKEEAIELLERDIIQYAKRQMTWWKRDKNIHWYPTNKFTPEMQQQISDFLKK